MSVTFSLAEFREDPQWGAVLCQLDDDRLDVNLSNANAAAVLERLGFEVTDDCGLIGQCTPDDLLGRAVVGNVGMDDSGVDVEVFDGFGGATMIDMGRRPGYFDDVMTRLIMLAAEGQEREVMVMWG